MQAKGLMYTTDLVFQREQARRVMLRLAVFITAFTLCNAFFWGKSPDWDKLQVTFGLNIFSSNVFAKLPRTESDAIEDGYSLISNCGENSKFAGKRYAKDGDTAVILIFDVNGYIAGLQAGIPTGQDNGYPFARMMNNPFVTDRDYYFITAYFTDPSAICSVGRTAEMFSSEGTGTQLLIQNGSTPRNVIKIPMNEADTTGSGWGNGKCFFGMGVHYWYNIQKDMSCDDFFPMFLLYNNNKLDGLGWAFGTDLPSPRYEHPDPSAFEKFMDPVPECLSYQGRLSTMHIYMSNPLLNFC
ncbi:uncharacterized protein [Haliotis cracherodii]|uniref:uncharacterized protein n=1 Tax=Haliotis cracherodii TaxID=6455 RepID=UPI0039E7C4D5